MLRLFFQLYKSFLLFFCYFYMNSTQLIGDFKSESMGPFLDSLLCLLETISDEIFWHNLLGERALNLLKRYFGSDVVFLGFIVYLARKLHTHTVHVQCVNSIHYSYCWLSV